MAPGARHGMLGPRGQWVMILAGVQSMLALALTGLFGFVIGNRIRR